MTTHDDATELPEVAPPLRPAARPDDTDAVQPAAVQLEPIVASRGPSKLRVGVVSGAAVALAVGAVATALASTPPSATGSPGSAPAAIRQVPAALEPALDPGALELDHGRLGGGLFRDITISAISGSNVTLTTEDGWTRTIALTTDTELTKGGQKIAVADLKVGDQVRFRQERNDDGTYTVTAIAVVVPSVGGTVSELTGSGFKVTTRDGSVWTITTDGATVYRYGAADGTRADIANGDRVVVLGESTGDNALRATTVQVAGDRAVGTVTAKTADTITIRTRGGETVTVHVSSDTEYRIRDVEDPGLDDVTVDMVVGVSGRERSDGSIDAAVVTTGRGLRDGAGPFGHGGPGLGRGPWGGEQGD